MKTRRYPLWCLILSIAFAQPIMGSTDASSTSSSSSSAAAEAVALAAAIHGGSATSSAGISAALKEYFQKNKNTDLANLYSSSDLKALNKTAPNPLTANPLQKDATADLLYAFMAGVTQDPGKKPVKKSFGIFSGGSSGPYDPKKLYKTIQSHAQSCAFVSSDALFNPQSKISPFRMVFMEDIKTVDNLSFNSIFSPTEATFQNFLCNIAPTEPPASLQNYMFQLNQTHAGDLKKHDKVSLYDPKRPNALKSNLTATIAYQQQRRRALAFQFVAMNNLALIRRAYIQDQAEAKNSLVNQLLSDMSQVTKMTSVEVARMNLLTNVLILKEIKKDHLIHELSLATLSLMLAQGNNASSQMLGMAERKAKKELRTLYGVPAPKPPKTSTKS